MAPQCSALDILRILDSRASLDRLERKRSTRIGKENGVGDSGWVMTHLP